MVYPATRQLWLKSVQRLPKKHHFWFEAATQRCATQLSYFLRFVFLHGVFIHTPTVVEIDSAVAMELMIKP